jgi:hypothetical protein
MRARVSAALLVAAILATHAGYAQAAGCAYPSAFPGETAAPDAVAAWMAARTAERGLPGELPVMSALARSGLVNLPADRAGRAGYFGMLERLWGDGPYAGFQGDPPLQLEWLLNQLIAIRDRAVFLGARHFGERSSQWGEWITLALVAGRPGAYEARLDDARALIETGCASPPPSTCILLTTYPGNAASRVEIASWMANGAREAGLPPELPLMAALVASGLKNLQSGEGDSVGFFQMRVGIWNQGPYAGFPDKPDLQLKWFLDQANAVRVARIAAGDADFGKDPAHWGEWIADVERPAEQFRGRYQLRLAEARQLVELACASAE